MPNKKAIKAAEKALAEAKSAVSDARQAVKKLDRKTRRKADDLRVELKRAAKSASKSIERDVRTATKRRAAQAEQITVRRLSARAEGGAPARDEVAADASTGPTYRELREQAKVRGIRGYSRMDKATLAAALTTS
ncbi:hypothetical protein ESP51_16465 [Agromyces albus]|uniref:Rho termination factor N-terminal domain-containing protein n=2 Tax=Agromyces albus TaxID=205332 RepID=A0A4Q2KQR1_9MICO|nr:hypothetical protein ESP51_16465 [Agromyces albus]